MDKLQKIEEMLREYENGSDIDPEDFIRGIRNVIDDTVSYGEELAEQEALQSAYDEPTKNDDISPVHVMRNIEIAILQKYCQNSEWAEDLIPDDWGIVTWLTVDIQQTILDEGPEAREDILSMIQHSPCADEILGRHIDMDKIDKNVQVRSDFASALASVRRGSDLSGILDYAFSEKDIANLAVIHQSGQFRTKIESLLTDCNFHEVSGDFHSKNYAKYLKPEQKRRETIEHDDR